MMVPSNNNNNKYSEDYLVQRIRELQDKIHEQSLPLVDDRARTIFVAACQAVQSSTAAKNQALAVLHDLEAQKNDDTKDLIEKAKKLVEACDTALECANETLAQSGRAIADSLELRSSVDELALLECTILIQSTPKGLAAWVAENQETHEKLLDSFLGNLDWMKLMIVGGGASNGNYGRAIAIHSTLLQQIIAAAAAAATTDKQPPPDTKIRHKVALAVALAHATPIPVFQNTVNTVIDPVSRFWHYVKAYENGELDENFHNFTVWELKLTIDSNAMDDELTWGRAYLKAYRPDQITNYDFPWRYLWSVRSDVGYRQPDYAYTTYKELISAGGECGPRAFFGRFICKAFGTPTWGVRQPGHAALSRWTPSGWKVCLGAGFPWSKWDDTRYGQKKLRSGLDFLEESQARWGSCPSYYYSRMDLLECLAECLGETIDEHIDPTKFWRSLSLVERRNLAAQHNNPKLVAVSVELEALGVSSPTNACSDGFQYPAVRTKMTIHTSGSNIVVPATAFVEPTKPDNKTVLTMDSIEIPGTQLLHLESNGSVGYKLPDFLPAGSFSLSARLVNIHRRQVPLLLSTEPTPGHSTKNLWNFQVAVPYTGGEWQTTTPVEVLLVPGSMLRISRDADCHGLTIKEFLLEPTTAISKQSETRVTAIR